MNNSALGLRPDKASTLQALGEQTQTVAIPPQQLDGVASSSAEHEHVSGERLFVQYVLHLRTQSIESAAQIRHSCCNPDLGPDRKLDHWRRLSRIERNSDGSAPLSTLIRARPGSSIWIAPPDERLNGYGVDYRSFTEQYLDSTGILKEAVIGILAAVAKQERVRLSERTIAGLERAKAQGRIGGRPKVEDAEPKLLAKIGRLRSQGQSIRAIAAEVRKSPNTVVRLLKSEHVA